MKRVFWMSILLFIGLTSFTVASEIEVHASKSGVTIMRKGDFGLGVQDHHIFIPGNGDNLQKIMKKALDWQKLNESHRKDFIKLIDEVSVYHSENHFKIIQSTEYNHKAAFRFQGTSDGGCRLIIEETKGRTAQYQRFHVVEGSELAAFAKLFELNKKCAADGIFE